MPVIKSPTQIREEQAKGLVSLLENLKGEVTEDREILRSCILSLNGALERFYTLQDTQLATADRLKRNILILCRKNCNEIKSELRCNVQNIADDTKDLIFSVIEEIKALGIPTLKQTSTQDNSVNINTTVTQNQEQSQTQSQEVNLLVDLLKNSLAPYQLEELKDVAKADIPVSEKRQNLMDKILCFGSNVGASVLANILTNPAVYSCL